MAKPTSEDTSRATHTPSAVGRASDPVLEAILAELRAIRAAIEKPRQTAERENSEFLASL